MSAEAVVSIAAVASLPLGPQQSTTFATLNGTDMTLILSNLNAFNSCSYSVVCAGIINDSGTLTPSSTKAFKPTDYQGNPLKVTNTSTPLKPANLLVTLS